MSALKWKAVFGCLNMAIYGQSRYRFISRPSVEILCSSEMTMESEVPHQNVPLMVLGPTLR